MNDLDRIKNSPSESLAAYIVLFKTLGIGEKLALECMKELALRRSQGESFNFEDFIETESAKIPKTSGNLEKITSTFSLKNLLQMVKK